MVSGYAGKFLDVDLEREKIEKTVFQERVLRDYIGGRALAARILWDRLGKKWREVDPLGPENILLALTGPMTGYYPGSRICVSGKSPLTCGIVGSTVGGEFPIELKCAGYDGVIVTGRAKKPVYLFIDDETVEIRNATHLWGQDGKQTVRMLNKEVIAELERRHPRQRLWREPGILYVGPAGENATRVAAVMMKWTHGAGYGGYGGVMGSKNLKAIVAKGTGPLPPPYDVGETIKCIESVTKSSFANDGMRRWGTGAAGYEVGAYSSSEPVRNWQEEWHDERSFGVDHFERRVWLKRYWGDYGCPTTCLKVSAVLEGPFKGAITDNPDYEIQAYLGTNLGIFEPEGNVYVAAKGDELGLCGIQGGNVLGFAGELYQRGILTKEEIGFELNWGDAKAFARLAEMVARREGIGDILAEGTYRAALKLGKMKGKDLLPYVVHAKGMAIGAHGIRSGIDYPPLCAYASSTQGGDHTSVGGLRPSKSPSELLWGFADSAVICGFNVFDDNLEPMWKMLASITGWQITSDDWNKEIGLRMLAIQRAALLESGPDVIWDPDKDDENPQRFYEPLPTGFAKGQTIDPVKVREAKVEYYTTLGWDERGIPLPSTLKRLGLTELEKVFQEKRK
ncbi:MAG: aldehyde ferredoxin oxidoreductase C-terminal domain-containing protein [Candidatus Bathyarchaeia archaeon]